MTTELPLVLALDLTGTFVFALNGALTAVHAARLDIVGVLTLGMITALGGGVALNQLWLGAYQDRGAPDFSENYGGWRWITGEAWLGVATNDVVKPRCLFGAGEDWLTELTTADLRDLLMLRNEAVE